MALAVAAVIIVLHRAASPLESTQAVRCADARAFRGGMARRAFSTMGDLCARKVWRRAAVSTVGCLRLLRVC